MATPNDSNNKLIQYTYTLNIRWFKIENCVFFQNQTENWTGIILWKLHMPNWGFCLRQDWD